MREEVGKCKLQSILKYPREISLVPPPISTAAAEQHPQICNVGCIPCQAGLDQNQATGYKPVLLTKICPQVFSKHIELGSRSLIYMDFIWSSTNTDKWEAINCVMEPED